MPSSPVVPFIGNIIVGLAATAFVAIVVFYLTRKQKSVPSDCPVLKLCTDRDLGWQLLGPLLLALLISALLSFVAAPILVLLRDGRLRGDSLVIVLRESVVDQLGWTLINYFIWGGLSVFVYAMAYRRTTVDERVFTTAAFLGGVLHQTTCSLGASYIGQFLLGGIQPKDLYNLQPWALFRLWVPLFLESLSAGVLLSYYLGIASNVASLAQFYVNRYRVTLIFLMLLTLIYPGVLTLGPGSFVVKSLRYNNVGLVWWGAVFICTIGILAGTEIYDRVIRPRWLQTSRPGVKHTASRR